MTPVEILEKARALIADPKHWTRKALARNSAGQSLTDSELDLATCFCSVGAIRKISPGCVPTPARGDAGCFLWEAINENVAHDGDKRTIAVWNDDVKTTHADVLAMFDRAIQMARAKLAESEAA